jgi:hypothetical protein
VRSWNRPGYDPTLTPKHGFLQLERPMPYIFKPISPVDWSKGGATSVGIYSKKFHDFKVTNRIRLQHLPPSHRSFLQTAHRLPKPIGVRRKRAELDRQTSFQREQQVATATGGWGARRRRAAKRLTPAGVSQPSPGGSGLPCSGKASRPDQEIQSGSQPELYRLEAFEPVI